MSGFRLVLINLTCLHFHLDNLVLFVFLFCGVLGPQICWVRYWEVSPPCTQFRNRWSISSGRSATVIVGGCIQSQSILVCLHPFGCFFFITRNQTLGTRSITELHAGSTVTTILTIDLLSCILSRLPSSCLELFSRFLGTLCSQGYGVYCRGGLIPLSILGLTNFLLGCTRPLV